MLHNYFGVEIFKVGTWNGNSFTIDDLNSIADAYSKTKELYNIPIKLGHNDEQKLLDGIPAAGWVENVRVKGDTLIADFRAVPEAVASLIHSGAYRKRSIELNEDFELGGNKYPLVLTGLALLGAKLPAVEGLADIVKLYASLELSSKENANILIFEDFELPVDNLDDLIAAFDEFHSRAERFFKGKNGAPIMRSISKIYKDGLRKANGVIKESKETMDDASIRKLLGLKDDDDIEEALKNLKKGDSKEHSKEEEKPNEEFTKLSGQVIELQKELAKRDVLVIVDAAISDGKLLPAQKEMATNFALNDIEGFKKFIESQPKVLEFGERGTQDGKGGNNNFDISKIEPTAIEIEAAKSLGTWSPEYRLSLMRTKAKNLNIELPIDFGKEKAS